MLDIFIPAFVTLFVVIDPPGITPIFASLTHGTSAAHKRLMAFKSCLLYTSPSPRDLKLSRMPSSA